MEKKREWFLVKDSWMDDFKDLSDAEFGMLIRGLYSNSATSTRNLDMLRKAIQTEFLIVNEKAKESYETRSSKAKDAANARWSKYKESEQERMHKHAQVLDTMLKHPLAFDINAQASLSNANIEEEEDIEIEERIKIEEEDTTIGRNNIEGSTIFEDIFLEDNLSDLKDKIDCLISTGSYTIGMKIPSSYNSPREFIEHQYQLNYKQ